MPKSFSPDLKRLLKKSGCYHIRAGKGDHERWFSPVTEQEFTVDNNIKSRHTANGTLKQAGLPKAF